MKCFACNYEYFHDDLEGGVRIGDEEFKILSIQGTMGYDKINKTLHSYMLFACPKCKTVRAEG